MENSHIEWTNHTFNPWWGCMKVSEGCKNCYAETLDNRYHNADPHWGPNSPRKEMSDKHWAQPFLWDEKARKAGVQAKVFCASMADVFEVSDDPVVINGRTRLFNIIENTPNLIWQLLTKRPENIINSIPESWRYFFPDNVWIGTSVENQKAADERIPYLLSVPAKVRFLSCEPLLGPLDLTNIPCQIPEWFPLKFQKNEIEHLDCLAGYKSFPGNDRDLCPINSEIHWVIAGGESGHGARPMHPDWATSLRDQCANAEVSFFFKQWGEYLPKCQIEKRPNTDFYGKPIHLPSPNNPDKINTYYKLGKKEAGSLLNGVEYKQFPNT